MPTRSPSPAIPVGSAERGISRAPDDATLPSELEARIAELEADPIGADFDRISWVWMILFGVALPIVLWVVGFRA